MRHVNLATLEAAVRDASKQGAICDSIAQHMLSQIGAQREENDRDAATIAHSDFRGAMSVAVAKAKLSCAVDPESMLMAVVSALDRANCISCVEQGEIEREIRRWGCNLE